MASNLFTLVADGQLATSAGDLVTTTQIPSGWEAVIQKMTLTNASGGSVNGVYIYLSADGTAAADDNTLLSNRTMDAGETLSVPIAGHVLRSGGKIMGKAGTATAITYHISLSRKIV